MAKLQIAPYGQVTRKPYAPHEVVVPLLGATDGRAKVFLGTASFVGSKALLLTANHVITDWSGEFLVAVSGEKDIRTFGALVVFRDARHDLALLEVRDYRPPLTLVPAFDSNPSPVRDIATLEYGTTEVAGEKIAFNPATRIGHVTRMFQQLPALGAAGVNAMELSFPALKGASGAPIIEKGTNLLWGVIVSNVSYHLLPCQIETVLDEKNQILEEVKYMLPLGVAVHIKHLKNTVLNA